MSTAWVALGSNLDEPRQQVEAGLRALAAIPRTRLSRRSSLYRTAPWGLTEQPDFINAVACVDTALEPTVLLDHLQTIEAQHGRRREGPRWGPRTLDLDLLLHGDKVLDTPALQLPHPRLGERAFVLLPLAELAPELHVPGLGPVAALLARLDTTTCHRIAPAPRAPDVGAGVAGRGGP